MDDLLTSQETAFLFGVTDEVLRQARSHRKKKFRHRFPSPVWVAPHKPRYRLEDVQRFLEIRGPRKGLTGGA